MADDAAKRREARRRRILMNSEDRMKKVMGLYKVSQDSSTEEADTDCKETRIENVRVTKTVANTSLDDVKNAAEPGNGEEKGAKEEKLTKDRSDNPEEKVTDKQRTETDVAVPTESIPEDETQVEREETCRDELEMRESSEYDSHTEREVTGTDASEREETQSNATQTRESSDSTVKREETGCYATGNEEIQSNATQMRDGNDSTSKKEETHSNTTSTDKTPRDATQVGESRVFTPTRTKRKPTASHSTNENKLKLLFMILLAFIVRLFISFSLYTTLLGKSIIVPFFTVQSISIYQKLHNTQVSHARQTKSMLTMALMLCGLPQATLIKASLVVDILSDIATDFTVYIFSFVVLHSFLELFA
ncbi:uncharacterized protein LOC144452374 [Glandiceps talaboti]